MLTAARHSVSSRTASATVVALVALSLCAHTRVCVCVIVCFLVFVSHDWDIVFCAFVAIVPSAVYHLVNVANLI